MKKIGCFVLVITLLFVWFLTSTGLSAESNDAYSKQGVRFVQGDLDSASLGKVFALGLIVASGLSAFLVVLRRSGPKKPPGHRRLRNWWVEDIDGS